MCDKLHKWLPSAQLCLDSFCLESANPMTVSLIELCCIFMFVCASMLYEVRMVCARNFTLTYSSLHSAFESSPTMGWIHSFTPFSFSQALLYFFSYFSHFVPGICTSKKNFATLQYVCIHLKFTSLTDDVFLTRKKKKQIALLCFWLAMLPSGSEPVRSRSKTNKQDINNTTRYKEIQIVLQNTKYAQSLRLLNNKPKRKGNREKRRKRKERRGQK